MDGIRYEQEGAIGWIVFDRPQRRNAITEAMWTAIPTAFAALTAAPDVRVIVMRGAGDEAFVSGADISEFEQARIGPSAIGYQRKTEAAFEAIAQADRPVIAMLQGWCIGGGAGIALQADLRYAADDTVFAIPPAKLGLGYGIANTQALIDVVGPAAAREILFTGRRYDASEALRLGVHHRVFAKADLETEVRKVAQQLAANAPIAIQSSKTLIRELGQQTPNQALMKRSVERCFASEDYKEGIRAFLQKRRPIFQGH